jgi:signal transduction histidine kinase
LAAILGNAETAQKMLDRDKLDVAELKEICSDIVSEDRRAADVIRRLSELYKRDRREAKPIDLNQLARETLDLLRTELLVRHVVLRAELPDGLPTVRGDRVQLQQVVMNLVLNAADAMSETKEERVLTLRTAADGGEVHLSVIDRGPGIPDAHLDTVFDSFWTTKAGGMGMGLAICKSIVAAHNGSIAASNNADGGATFRVVLPAGDVAT